MDYRDYWKEAVGSSLDEAGVTVTAQQIEAIAGDMEVADGQLGMAFGHDVADQNLQGEKDRQIGALRKALRNEQEKETCKTCGGRGFITEQVGSCHSSTSECHKCRGAGRL